MSKKAKSILDGVIEVANNYRANTGMTWFDRLAPDAQKELLEVRDAIHSGKIYGPRRMLARAIIRMCEERGFRVCGHQGVESWLKRK